MQDNSTPKIIGRDANCDIVINDLSISRNHAKIVYNLNQKYFNITDLDSTNGITINGQKIRSTSIANFDDKIQIGDLNFELKNYFKEEFENYRKSFENNKPKADDNLKPTSLTIKVSVGRTLENHIILDDSSISRKHAEIIQIDWKPSFIIKDLGSTNGTFVNGERINGESKRVDFTSFVRFGLKEFNLKQMLSPFIDKANLNRNELNSVAPDKTIIQSKIVPVENIKINSEVSEIENFTKPDLNQSIANEVHANLEVLKNNKPIIEYPVPESNNEADKEIIFTFKFNQLFDKYSSTTLSDPIDLHSVGREYPEVISVGNYILNNKEYPYVSKWGSTNKGAIIDWNKDNEDNSNQLIQNIAIRLIACIPPKKINVKIFDFAGNGLSFADLMALDSKIISNDVIDNASECNNFLSSHRAKTGDLIRNVLMNKAENIIHYNNENKDLAVNIDLFVINRFPFGWDSNSFSLLIANLKNGIKTGTVVLMSIDYKALEQMLSNNKDLEAEFSLENLKKDFVTFSSDLKHQQSPSFPIYNEAHRISISSAKIKNITEIINSINKEVHKSENIEIDIRSRLGQLWSGDSSKGLKIPIGQSGLSVMDFEIGSTANVHHALIGGANGSGKSVLLHNIIINGAHLYSPDELQFVLLDYKEGTEFKIYEQLPHMFILSIESKRSFGVSVLEYLQEEIVSRARLFKTFEAANIAEYKERSGNTLPRLLIVIDEFQVLLSGDVRLSNEAADKLEDISRRGRSFGINLVLSSQSLSNVNISTSTLSNLNLRIALKMNELDAARFMSNENSLPVKFTRPGQAVYNSTNGLSSGNIEFQVAFVENLVIKEKIKELYNNSIDKFSNQKTQKYVFDGSKSPSLFDLNISEAHIKSLKTINSFDNLKLVAGFPVHLSPEPNMALMSNQSGSNVLIVGKDNIGALDIIHNLNCQLLFASLLPKKLIIFDLFKKGAKDLVSGIELHGRLSEIKQIADNESIDIYHDDKELIDILDILTTELEDRKTLGAIGKPSIYISIAMFENAKELEPHSSALDNFKTLLMDGPENGIHFLLFFSDPDSCQEILDSKEIKQFDTIIALKGEGASAFVGSYVTLKEDGYAMIKSSFAKYGVDNIRINSRIQEI